jgi:hypothetical protein
VKALSVVEEFNNKSKKEEKSKGKKGGGGKTQQRVWTLSQLCDNLLALNTAAATKLAAANATAIEEGGEEEIKRTITLQTVELKDKKKKLFLALSAKDPASVQWKRVAKTVPGCSKLLAPASAKEWKKGFSKCDLVNNSLLALANDVAGDVQLLLDDNVSEDALLQLPVTYQNNPLPTIHLRAFLKWCKQIKHLPLAVVL